MKKKVNFYILLIVVFANLMILGGISFYAKRTLQKDISNQHHLLKSQVTREYNNFEVMLSLVENYTKEKNQANTIQMAERLVNKWGKPQNIPLDTLKKITFNLGVDDIYLINKKGLVLNSSLKDEIGYNLANEGPEFKRFFESLFLSNEFYNYCLGIGEADKQVKLYSYYVPEGATFAVETSINVENYLKNEFNLKNHKELFFDLKTQLEKRKHIIDFDLFNLTEADQASLFDTQRKLSLSPSHWKKLNKEGTLSFETETGEIYYQIISMSPEFFGFPAKLAMMVEYNFEPYYREFKNMILLSLFITFLALLLITLFSPKIVESHLIQKIEIIKHNLNAIKLTHYNNLKPLEGNDELAEIADDINELRNSVVIREEQLQEAKLNAESADKLKSAFLANMSHEIRTPLNAVVGFAQLLRDIDASKGDMLKYIDLINSNSDKLLQIISDIIDLSQIESGQLRLMFKPVCLKDLMKEIHLKSLGKLKKSWLIDNKTREIDIKVEMGTLPNGECIITDHHRLKQIFYQLIDNAIKFTCKGSITIGFRHDNNYVAFYVRDTGIGIAKEDMDRIFDRFVQVEEYMTRQYGGTGLGLAICSGLINLLGGKLEVDSKLGEGSTFTFKIPYRTD